MELDLVLMILEYKSVFFLLLRWYFSLWLYVGVVVDRKEQACQSFILYKQGY